jgi:hypothetical protein
VEDRRKKARLIWEALIELQDRRGEGVFSGTYRWQYHQWRSASFDAHFVRLLNHSKWVTDADGDLVEPSNMLFEALGWPANPFLQSRIVFKKPIVEELAREAGFEPDMLDMLKKLGVTSKADLLAKLKVEELSSEDGDGAALSGKEDDPIEGTDAADEDAETGSENGSDDKKLEEDYSSGAGEKDERERDDGDAGDDDDDDDRRDASANENSTSSRGEGSSRANRAQGAANQSIGEGNDNRRSTDNQKPAERKFVSYVATDPKDEDENDPDGLDHSERMALEAKAIDLIRAREPNLKTMPAGNKGFDLVDTDANDEPERWIEVKAMRGCLEDRPVGLSSAQFEFARQHGDQYWLYVVEHADDDRSRIVKIKDPVGRSGTFTFDKGWLSVADIDTIKSEHGSGEEKLQLSAS